MKSIIPKKIDEKELLNPWISESCVGGLLSKSSWSLALICLWRKRFSGRDHIRVWVPEYFCEQALALLRKTGANVHYYPINENLTPNLSNFKNIDKVDYPDILVGVHYFGRPNQLSSIWDFSKKTGAWVVEDAVHILRPINGVGNIGDFVLYSPHKHLALRNGSILLISMKGPSKFEEKLIEQFDESCNWATYLEKQIESRSGNFLELALDLIWIGKRVIQKIGYVHKRKIKAQSKTALKGLDYPKISLISKKLLQHESKYIDLIHFERFKNQKILDDVVKKILIDEGMEGENFICERSNGINWTSYMCGYQFNSDSVKYITDKLNRAGLMPSKWPDLSEKVVSDQNSIAKKLYECRVFIQNHNSIKKTVLLKIYSADGNDIKQVQITTKEIEIEQWDKVLGNNQNISYLQENFYCSAKTRVEGWKLKKILFSINNSPIAVLHLLSKRKFRFLNLLRINCGPTLLRDLTMSETKALWLAIAKFGNLLKFRILFIAPNLKFNALNISLLNSCGFIRKNKNCGISSVVDLTLSVDDIQKNLKTSWRSILKKSNSSSVTILVSESMRSYHEAVAFYQKFRNEKNFYGPDIEFLKEIGSADGDQSRVVTFQGRCDEELQAIICVLLNRNNSTYLIGGSIGKARELKAGYQLIWNAMVYLKAKGIKNFDVGGINVNGNSGVAKFKYGLGGREYMLVGEYIKF